MPRFELNLFSLRSEDNILSFSPQESVWPHLIRTVLPGALADTGLLLAGVAVNGPFFE